MPADLTQDILNSNLILQAVRAIPNPELISDETANDSDKIITVDTGQIWKIISIYTTLITDATVGNREMQIQVRDDSDDIILLLPANATQAASSTRTYSFFPGAPWASSHFSNQLLVPIPFNLFLPPGYDLRIRDAAAVAAAADDLDIQLLINRFDI